jgi:succinate dehydrogenase/fumarate reductase flavoprotein subunit
MLTTAAAVVKSALARAESRGAHQREDFPEAAPEWLAHQVINDEHCTITRLAR